MHPKTRYYASLPLIEDDTLLHLLSFSMLGSVTFNGKLHKAKTGTPCRAMKT